MSTTLRKFVVNRGKRNHIMLRPGPDGKQRILEPGKSMECLDEAEFKSAINYNDIADVDIIAPQISKREDVLRSELAKLEEENRKLREQRNATPAPAAEVAPEVEEDEPVERSHKEEPKHTKKKGR